MYPGTPTRSIPPDGASGISLFTGRIRPNDENEQLVAYPADELYKYTYTNKYGAIKTCYALTIETALKRLFSKRDKNPAAPKPPFSLFDKKRWTTDAEVYPTDSRETLHS
jgi:hypothetical protein